MVEDIHVEPSQRRLKNEMLEVALVEHEVRPRKAAGGNGGLDLDRQRGQTAELGWEQRGVRGRAVSRVRRGEKE